MPHSRIVFFGLALFVSACAPFPDGPPDSAPSTDRGEVIPRAEPKSSQGNPPYYEAFGQRYYVMESNSGYVERGVASWYGKKFHGRNTANGEIFDMYAMTAAHKTLPLPTFAQVTNLKNGKSVVIRINDRGPFVHNRLIDLSWYAANELDFDQAGTTLVEVRALDPAVPKAQQVATAEPMRRVPEQPEPGFEESDPPPEENRLYLQVGAFAELDNAKRMRNRLENQDIGNVVIHDSEDSEQRLYKVRIGPVQTVDQFDGLVENLQSLGIYESHLAYQ